MSDHWKRWRAYVDDVEDVLRRLAAEADAAERDAATEHERGEWPPAQEQARITELARIALDTPFFGALLREVHALDSLDLQPRPDAVLRPWECRERSLDRIALVDARALAPPPPGARAPERLVRAEAVLGARTRSLIPVLEDLTIPRNASAVIRTAEALGLQELHFAHGGGALSVQRSVSKGAHVWLDVEQSPRIETVMEQLGARGYRILAADHDARARPLDEVELGVRNAVVFGSEQRGVSDAVRARADALFFVPVCGFTNYLNVSVAAAVALYALDRRLRAAGSREPLARDDAHRIRVRWYHELAGSDLARQARYLRWLHRPPRGEHASGGAPSREKRQRSTADSPGRPHGETAQP